jgi:DNA invertase Pin-like site-specific DNA recombinase
MKNLPLFSMLNQLGRLTCNAANLLTLRDSGGRFRAVDLPEANDLTVGIMALVAAAEREAISRRTKEALAVAKVRGSATPTARWRCGGRARAPRRSGRRFARNAEANAAASLLRDGPTAPARRSRRCRNAGMAH